MIRGGIGAAGLNKRYSTDALKTGREALDDPCETLMPDDRIWTPYSQPDRRLMNTENQK